MIKINCRVLLTTLSVFALTFLAQSQSLTDSLKQELINIKQDTNQINTLLELGKQYEQTLSDTAIFYYKKALCIAKSSEKKKYISKCLLYMGAAYENIGFYNKALEYYQNALIINIELKDKNNAAINLAGIANIFFYKSNYDEALEYYQKALKINEETENINGVAGNLGNIGNTLYYIGEYNKALGYYQRVLKIQKENSDKNGIATSFINIGNIYSYNSNNDKALEYYNKALMTLKELNNKNLIALCYINIGIVYVAQNNYSKALGYYKKALEINRINNDKRGEAYTTLELATLYNKMEKYDTTIYYAKNALSLAKIIGSKGIQKDAYICLSDVFRNLMQYAKSLKYKDSIIIINDSIFNTEKSKAIAEMQTRYESEQKEKQIIKQKSELEKNKLKIKNQQSQRNLFIIGFGLSLLLVIIIFLSFKQKQKANAQLTKQKQKLSYLNKKLIQTNEELTASVEMINTQNQTIKDSEKKLKVLVNSANDAIILIDNNEKISLWNKASEKIFGYTKEEVLQKNLHELITPEKYRQIAHNAFSYFKNTGKGDALNKMVELEGLKKDGTVFPIELSLSAIRINNKWNALGSIRDISERKKQEIKLLKSKKKIEEIHKNIINNINYSKIIQQALLPTKEMLNDILSEYFVLFSPKDIIGGDFYYVNKINKRIFFAVGDCTGHGVSGALLSILGITYLHDIISKNNDSPDNILDLLRSRIKNIFKSFGSDNNNGLDIALCVLDTETKILNYSGAFSPLWIIRNRELINYTATKTSVAICPTEKSFENHTIQLKSKDIIYLFSDGYADQFGGKDNKKFLIKHFRELLIQISDLPLIQQKQYLLNTLNNWKGKIYQTDDITVMGLKL